MAKQRQVRIEQSLPQSLMEDMQERSDEQLEAETKHRSIALALLGARAAERYDAPAARTYFRRAIAAARPQERIQIRRMADASLALAERRPDDLKAAVERLGQEAPSGRALFGLRVMGLIAPPPGASILLRVRGFAIVALIVIGLLAAGLAVVELIWLPFGGIGLAPGLLLGLIVVGIALAVLAWFGRRRQAKARAAGKTAGGSKGSLSAKEAAAVVRGKSPAKPSGKTPVAKPSGRGSVAARFSTGRGASSAKSSAGTGASTAKSSAGKGASTAKSSAGKGASTAKPSGKAASPAARGSTKVSPAPKSGSSNGGQPRRGGEPRATGSAQPSKPAEGSSPAPGNKRPARPKRPSR